MATEVVAVVTGAEVTGAVVEVVVAEDAGVAEVVAGAANLQIGTAIPMLRNSVNSSLVDCLQTPQKTR